MANNEEFVWPYAHAPYGIQVDLMRAITSTLNEAKSGVFESPTGSGKTASIICSVIPWLLKNLDKSKDEAEKESSAQSAGGGGDEPSWLADFVQAQDETQLNRLGDLRAQREARVLAQNALYASSPGNNNVTRGKKVRLEFEEEEIAEQRKEEAEEFAPLRKVYFCSRTHTQLAQFAKELRGVNGKLGAGRAVVSSVILGSRNQLCVNEEIKALGGGAHVNDACLDLNDTKAKCPFNSPAVQDGVNWLADYALNESLPDLEDLTSHKLCAYYASRQAAQSAQVVLLPYTSILNQEMVSGNALASYLHAPLTPRQRTALNIDLRGNVIVFDEAHNLVEAVADSHSTSITFAHLQTAISDVNNYLAKYDRLNLDTRNLLLQLSTLIMPKLLSLQDGGGGGANNNAQVRCITINEFLSISKLDDFNFLPLLARAKELKLNRKLKAVSSSQITILAVLSFLHSLANNFETGRIKLTPNTGFKFFLLDIASKFAEIVGSARSVLLCGGTMHPADDVLSQLFPNASSANKVTTFSCGHVIPEENLRVLQVSTSPTGRELRFTHEHNLYEDLQSCLRNLCAVVPRGIVVFFPSYAMLERFTATAAAAALSAFKKPVLVEKRSTSGEDVFAQYQAALANGLEGAMLLAVVGGRLSEGINFSDDLARCVVMVGLPFPNRHEAELQAKINYHESRAPGAGNRYLENQCWKAVNQSVGRAIRHQRDYAMVVLLDVRYAGEHARARLPRWIAQRYDIAANWGALMRATVTFFKSKN